MSRAFASLLALGLLVASGSCTSAARGAIPLVLRDVTLIDGTGAPPRPNTTLVIDGDRITSIGPSAEVDLPPGARVIDGAGRTVIPGLWDVHVHLSKAKEEALPVLVANGVTSVRDMGGDLEELERWRHQIDTGERVGPRIVLAGPMLESPATIDRLRHLHTRERWRVTRVVVPDSASADAIVDSVAALGVDFIKIRSAVSPAVYAAIVHAAHRRGLPVAGHPPYTMDPVEAAALDVASFEHASYPYPLDPDPDARSRVLRAFVDHHVVIVPTLVAWRTRLMDRDSLAVLTADSLGERDPRRRLISDFLADEWRFDIEAEERKSDDAVRGWWGFFDRQAADLRVMHEAGIPMLPGSDLAGPALFPGYSLQDELENLVELVGLTPEEAIESATRLAATLCGRDHDLGTLEVGKLADLVVLDADPLADIRNTRRIVGVLSHGRYVDAEVLHRLLGGLSPSTRGDIRLLRTP